MNVFHLFVSKQQNLTIMNQNNFWMSFPNVLREGSTVTTTECRRADCKKELNLHKAMFFKNTILTTEIQNTIRWDALKDSIYAMTKISIMSFLKCCELSPSTGPFIKSLLTEKSDKMNS